MSAVRRIALLLGLVAIAVALLPMAAEARIPKVFFGIDQGGTLQERDFEQMHAIKVRTMRVTINWGQTETSPGNNSWGRTDERVAALARNGISPAFTIFGSPRWAIGSGNSAVAPLTGDAPEAWQRFLKAAVNRYKNGGKFWQVHPELTPKPATSWQIWNEPNLPKYFSKPANLPIDTPKAYARLVKASEEAIHSADKNAKVVLAGLSGNPRGALSSWQFLKKVLRVRGIAGHFDAAAVHPYTPKVVNFKQLLSKFRKTLNRGHAKKKQIWITEIGWGSANNGQGMNKGITGQARALKTSFKLIVKNRKKWKIGRVYWFDWRDPTPSGGRALCSFCPSAGLLRHDGSHKPSYAKFKRFTKLQGKRTRHHRHRHHHHRHRRHR